MKLHEITTVLPDLGRLDCLFTYWTEVRGQGDVEDPTVPIFIVLGKNKIFAEVPGGVSRDESQPWMDIQFRRYKPRPGIPSWEVVLSLATKADFHQYKIDISGIGSTIEQAYKEMIQHLHGQIPTLRRIQGLDEGVFSLANYLSN
jgi:hypothetical protein